MAERKYWVYVLESDNGKRYVGHTNDLKRRLDEHKIGISPYIRMHGIKSLLYKEIFTTRFEVMNRDRFLKSGKGRE